ncbi:TetR/AcrR family transcriptional regulator [Mycobacterium barrassiae]|uniref:TetR/AcrR family transcriptional regulator n=1 Tax=Mycobacterium barrassiae TaxID=319709 RepID=UPI002265F3A6|nr:TetR/AcrR family transcriptional regulator [Mycobacterium barrassiae]MCV7301061.1 TetR/AcrR family transcriptional regulator [Mycobacterium barrassiae]
MSRVETAAATRRALLAEAAALLESGGPAAVTLREVGARAGVSRGAPYGHFADKESLLTAVAAEGWNRIGDEMQRLRDDSALAPEKTLRAALLAIITVSRENPHLYQLMFTRPVGDPEAVVRAAQRTCEHFHDIVAAVTGQEEASRHAAVLLTGTHGAAGVETSGLLDTDKWHTTAEELIDMLLATVAKPSRRR